MAQILDHMTIFLFRDETEITYCNSRISRQDQDFRKLFLVVEREQMKLTLVENSLDREFLLNSVVGLRQLSRGEDNCSKYSYQNSSSSISILLFSAHSMSM